MWFLKGEGKNSGVGSWNTNVNVAMQLIVFFRVHVGMIGVYNMVSVYGMYL